MSKTGGIWRGGAIPYGVWNGEEAITTRDIRDADALTGRSFEAEGYFPDQAASSETNTIFLTGSLPLILRERSIDVNGVGVFAEIYEGPTYTGGNPPAPIYNTNRVVGAVPQAQIIGGVTVTDPGVLAFAPSRILGSSGQGQSRVASTRPLASGYRLKPNTAYLFRITNLDTSNPQTWLSRVVWYEGPARGGDVA